MEEEEKATLSELCRSLRAKITYVSVSCFVNQVKAGLAHKRPFKEAVARVV